MTYFGFLLRFIVVPILILLVISYWENKKNRPAPGFRNGRAVWIAIGVHVLLAVVYTTPWDNYLVASGVWYYNPQLVTGLVIGYVPIEEYTFFVLETILAGLWWWFLARRISTVPASSPPVPRSLRGLPADKLLIYCSTALLSLVWLLATYLFFFDATRWTYLSIILFWALPAIILQTLFGADILWQYRKLVAWAILVPSLYLSLMDIIALQETTWSISPAHTTGILFFGILPLEEVVFFFITNTLISFGLTLLLAQASPERLATIMRRFKVWKAQRAPRLPSR